jgi:hypothetical protein
LRRTQITVVEQIRECFDAAELLQEIKEKPQEIGVRQAGTALKMQV